MLEVIAGVQSAARHKSIGGAYRSGISKCNLYIVIIILLKEGIGKDAEDVTAIVIPVFGYELGRNLLQLVGKTFFTGHIETISQGGGHSIEMLVFVFPKIKAAGIFPAACVRNIKNILETWIVAACVNQRNALRPTTDESAHLFIPKVIVGTGGGVRFLSKNHQLLMKWIFV